MFCISYLRPILPAALLPGLCVLVSACIYSGASPNGEYTHHPTFKQMYENLSFEMPPIREPEFSPLEVSIEGFGAVGDGKTMNTAAIREAIEYVAEKGGGKVIIPRGIWLTGPILLESHINLHTEAGALVIFSRNFDDYPLVATSFEGLDTYRCTSPIWGRNLENIAITGEGIFDGSGDAWRFVKKSKLTASQWKKLVASGGVLNEKGDSWYPTAAALKGAQFSAMNVPDLNTREEHEAIRDFLRPVMLSLVNCKGVLLDGPVFQNSPAWCLHPLMCENVIIRNITVKNPWYSQNGDGLDVESCRNVLVYNSTFDVGDDAICIKSGKDEDGRKRAIPAENIVIKHCTVYHGHGGFTVGSEMSGGVRNIQVSACTFIGTDVGLRFKSTRGRGGIVEKIYINDINMVNIPAEPLLFNMYYTGNSPIPEAGDPQKPEHPPENPELAPVTEKTPSFRDIHISRLRCIGAGTAIRLQGLPEMPIRNIHMNDIYIESDKGMLCMDAEGIEMNQVSILADKGPAITFWNTRNVRAEGFTYQTTEQPVLKVLGQGTANLTFTASQPPLRATAVYPESSIATGRLEID